MHVWHSSHPFRHKRPQANINASRPQANINASNLFIAQEITPFRQKAECLFFLHSAGPHQVHFGTENSLHSIFN